MIFLTLVLSELLSFFILIFIPYAVSIVTKLFYQFNREDGIEIKAKFTNKALELTDDEKSAKIRIRTKFQVGVFLGTVILLDAGLAFLGASQFKEFFV